MIVPMSPAVSGLYRKPLKGRISGIIVEVFTNFVIGYLFLPQDKKSLAKARLFNGVTKLPFQNLYHC